MYFRVAQFTTREDENLPNIKKFITLYKMFKFNFKTNININASLTLSPIKLENALYPDLYFVIEFPNLYVRVSVPSAGATECKAITTTVEKTVIKNSGLVDNEVVIEDTI